MYHHLLCGLSLSKKKTGHPFLKMCVHSISWANTIATVIHTVSKTATPMHMHATLAGSQSARHALQNHKYTTVLLENITACDVRQVSHIFHFNPAKQFCALSWLHVITRNNCGCFFNFRLYNALNFVQKYTK